VSPSVPSGYVRRPLAAATVAVAASLVTAGLTQGFVVAAVAVVLVNGLPGPVLTFGIQSMGSSAQGVGLFAALLVTLAVYGAAAAVGVRLARAREDPLAGGLAAAVLCWAATTAVTGLALTSLGPGLAMGVALANLELSGDREVPHRPERRQVLRALAGGLGLVGLGGVLGRDELGVVSRPSREAVIADEEHEAARERVRAARAAELDVEGLPSLVSTAGTFYEVDINAVDPQVDAADWSLSVTGAVERERSYDLADVAGMATEHRTETLRCVGESLNGRKLDTAVWTGTPVAALLADAAPLSSGCCVMLRADDGYFEEFPLAALRDGLLAYGMNGDLLPRSHGYPVRALVPGHWGEINVKWLTEIEVLEREAEGYWEQRGWHGTGPVTAVAKLWTTSREGDRVTVAGPAYAGTRGVARVEVSTDGGDTWTDATLSDPLSGRDVWRQWVHRYDHPGAAHEVVVRAVDGEGTVQPRKRSDPFPSGPSGWVSTTVER
jgi:DMSO/TMAO reductase YedYZ molybdopterin-dependent catalytic subunit